jgi:ferric-dicitrate binding protein FerR (iron transport regulator)
MKDLDWELFDRYLANAATPAERDEFERWLSARPERAQFLMAWNQALAKMESGMAAADRNAVWTGPLERIGASVEADRERSASVRPLATAIASPQRSAWRLGAGMAAAAVLVTGAVLAGRALLLDTPGTLAVERVIVVPRGERGQVRLSDGTRVMLAAGSTLRHPAEFSRDSRDVLLEGEGYFVVEHDARRPFRVRAGDLVATDLGTEFLVRAYPEDAGARVVVRSGEVAVRAMRSPGAAGKEQVIRPGQLGRLEIGGVPLVEQADTAAYFAWTRGTLAFDGTPLREALPQLSRWYDLEFRLADTSLGSIPLSGRLDETLTDARLDLLAGSLGLVQQRAGDYVTLSRP